MTTIGLYIPTLGRAHRLEALLENVTASTSVEHTVIFVREEWDILTQAACDWLGCRVLVNRWDPSYSNSLQTAYEDATDEFFVAANDDFEFTRGWDENALAAIEGYDVVGLHDGNPGTRFSTISLNRRSYIETLSGVIDIPNRVQYPYRHNYGDTEFYFTAVHRGVFTTCPDSLVVHVHPDFGLGAVDDTYMKSRATVEDDYLTFLSRAHLWGGAT